MTKLPELTGEPWIRAWRAFGIAQNPDFMMDGEFICSIPGHYLFSPVRSSGAGSRGETVKFYPNEIYYAQCRLVKPATVTPIEYKNRSSYLITKVGKPELNIHFPPEENCTCGFYAWKHRFQAVNYAGQCNVNAIAEVYLGGKVIEHVLGYRAEQMMIKKVHILRKNKLD